MSVYRCDDQCARREIYFIADGMGVAGVHNGPSVSFWMGQCEEIDADAVAMFLVQLAQINS